MRRRPLLMLLPFLAVLPVRAESVAEIFKRIEGSVVLIRTTERAAPERPGMMAAGEAGLGSGVLLADGRVLTASHVVQIAESIFVEIGGGETLSAKVVASAPGADLALLQLERTPMTATPAILGDSDKVQVGDQILVVGAPLGMTRTLSVGHISGRRIPKSLYGGFFFAGGEMFQTDASINPGNSGGPMFDMSGNVVGIVSHIIFGEAGAGGLGFVATSNMAKELVLSGNGMWSGMEGYVLEGEMARIFQLPQARGILVQRVAAGSPAQKLGLIPGSRKARIGDDEFLVGGDVLLGLMGISVADSDAQPRIRAALSGFAPGKTISVVVLRGGKKIELTWTPPSR